MIGPGEIETSAHQERAKCACQGESTKDEALDFCKRAKAKIAADHEGDHVHFPTR
jgi:hypothetical protein